MQNFIHIPKTGGLSIAKIIDLNDSIFYCGHNRAADIKSFSIVRNPYDRLVSAYFYLIDKKRIDNPNDKVSRELLLRYKSFKDFVLHLESDSLVKKIIHLYPMSFFVCDDQKNIIVDTILKFEDRQAIEKFLWENGAIGSDVKENTSTHKPYEFYLDQEVVREINRIYYYDFILFDYELLSTRP